MSGNVNDSGMVWRITDSSDGRNVSDNRQHVKNYSDVNSSVVNTTAAITYAVSSAGIWLMGVQTAGTLTGTLTLVGLSASNTAYGTWVVPALSIGPVLPPGNARRCASGLNAILSSAADAGKVLIDWSPI